MFTSNLKSGTGAGQSLFGGNTGTTQGGNQGTTGGGGMFGSGTGYTPPATTGNSYTTGAGFFSGGGTGGSSYTTGANTTGTYGGSYGFFGNKQQETQNQPIIRQTRELYSGPPVQFKGVTVLGAPPATTTNTQSGYSGFFNSGANTYSATTNNAKISAVDASSIIAEAKLIRELTSLRPLGSGLPSLRIESETSAPKSVKGQDKIKALELDKYRILYASALNPLENFRLSSNPYLNKLVSSFNDATRQQIVQAHKAIKESAAGIDKLKKDVGICTKTLDQGIGAKTEALMFKMKSVAAQLETFKTRLQKVGQAIDIQKRFEEGVRSFITDFKQGRDLDLSRLPYLLREILGLMTASVQEVLQAIEEVQSMRIHSHELQKGEQKHYMESFGEIFELLLQYLMVVSKKATNLREWLRTFKTEHLNTREFRSVLPTRILPENSVEPLAKKLDSLGNLFFS